MMPTASATGVILAGGLGRRMSPDGGTSDKGLRTLSGRPMIEHVVERFAPQVAHLLINANRNADAYARYGHPIVSDRITGHVGPLAGLHAGMTAADTRYVATVPCDSPFLPLDLVARLSAALGAGRHRLAVASAGGRIQPVFVLAERALLPDLEDYLARGERKIDLWFRRFDVVEVEFDDANAFVNINTPDELLGHESR